MILSRRAIILCTKINNAFEHLKISTFIDHFQSRSTMLFVASILSLLLSNGTSPNSENLYTDPRDNQSYETVTIGTKTWFKENLNYSTSQSVCYDYLESNCEKYGRLYPLDDAQAACPEYWRLPTPGDIEMLYKEIGTKRIQKIASPGEWHVRNSGRFSNSSGLSILPAGRIDSFSLYSNQEERWIDTLAFHQKDIAASYWLDDIETSEGVLHWHLGSPIGERKSGMHRHHVVLEEHKFSIRCVCDKRR